MTGDADARFNEWNTWLGAIDQELSEMMTYRFAFQYVRDVIQVNPELPQSHFLLLFSGMYVDSMVLAIGEELDPDNVLVGWWGDGFEMHAPLGIRIAQALHHGTDHRSQICTALTMLGVKPPDIDAWDFGGQDGRVVEVPATS